ncbi:hypothetical protein NFI96_004217 [Prochilodus magdalenae]|nr:hypothetical protein NFI96_004217 [Prochilodus magdalenae]
MVVLGQSGTERRLGSLVCLMMSNLHTTFDPCLLILLMMRAQDFRVYVQEVVEFGEGVSFLLLLPPCEDVCTPPGQNNPYSLRSGFFTLPLQIFELVHFEAYCPRFIGQYCRASAVLGLESLMSQQALREAFSESELLAAKEKHHKIQELLQLLEASEGSAAVERCEGIWEE